MEMVVKWGWLRLDLILKLGLGLMIVVNKRFDTKNEVS